MRVTLLTRDDEDVDLAVCVTQVEEGKRYMLDGKTQAVKEVRRMEENWRQMSRQQVMAQKPCWMQRTLEHAPSNLHPQNSCPSLNGALQMPAAPGWLC